MKRNFKLFGFAAFLTIAAFTFTACGGAEDAPATETETEVVADELEATNETEAVNDQEAADAEAATETDSTEAATEGKCGEGKCGEGKCG